MNAKRVLIHSLCGAGIGLLIAASAALGAEHGTAGDTHEAGAHAIELNNGKRWETDAPLRQGMMSIRNAMAADHALIAAGKESAAQYQALAERVDAQLAYIVGNCKLEPEADANLHAVLADLIAGSDSMKSKNAAERRDGATKIIDALQTYPQYFHHPGWRALD